jgi:hypothetical protein
VFEAEKLIMHIEEPTRLRILDPWGLTLFIIIESKEYRFGAE